MQNIPKIKTNSFKDYMESSLEVLRHKLELFFEGLNRVTIEDIKNKVNEINAYPNLDRLETIKGENITILDEEKLDFKQAEEVVLNGEFFWEHAAAGEATRLELGTKYLIDLRKFSLEEINNLRIKEVIKESKGKEADIEELKKKYNNENLKEYLRGEPKDLLPIKLGTRHMLQMAFDIIKLAKKNNKNPKEILKKQKTLIIVNETTTEEIIKDFEEYDYFGLDPKNVFFMIQRSFHGIDIDINGRLFYDTAHDIKRLHNHGQMVLQKAHDNVIFFIDPDSKQKIYLKAEEFEKMLQTQKDMVSYNIEDIGYLTNSIDWPSLALSLDLSKQGYEMVMEIVAQNPLKPQKGGAAFYDPALKRACMVESNRLLGMKNEDIKHLNKNFNHYPKPAIAFRKMKELGIHMPFEVKKIKDKEGNIKYYIYFNPVQGDLNFHLRTAYVMRKEFKSIQNLKSPATIPPTIKAMLEQDKQEGFKEFIKNVKEGKYK